VVAPEGESRESSNEAPPGPSVPRTLDQESQDLPAAVEADLGDAGLLLGFNGSPHSATDIIAAMTPPDELDRMLGGDEQPVGRWPTTGR
jgi:hypothetical protein